MTIDEKQEEIQRIIKKRMKAKHEGLSLKKQSKYHKNALFLKGVKKSEFLHRRSSMDNEDKYNGTLISKLRERNEELKNE